MKQPTRNLKLVSASALLLLACVALTPAALHAQRSNTPYRVLHYDLDATLQPEVHLLSARATLQLLVEEPLALVTFQLNRNLRVSKVTGADGQELSFEQVPQSPRFQVALLQTLAEGDELKLTIEYGGPFDPALQSDRTPALGVIAAGGSYLLPESRWFPQSRNPWDRFTMKLAVTVPADETVLASGRAEEPTDAPGSTRRFVFHVTEPARAGTLIAGKYEKISQPDSPMVTFYLLTVSGSYASANAVQVRDILEFYSDRFGALDPPDIAVVEIADNRMEAYDAPGLLLLPTRQWATEISTRLLARHLASQWWSVLVAPATRADVWLSDGLARYSEALFVNSTAGEQGFRQVLEDLTIGALVDESAAAIINADRLSPYSPEYSSIVRDKGAMVFHMLRQVIGDEDFFQLLTAYVERFAGRNLTIDQFERFAEEISGEPLDYFFGEWIRSTGVPQFELEYVTFRTREGFRIDGAVKHELEIFRMPVLLRVETEGPPVTQTVDVRGKSSGFVIESFGKPLKIQIDPDFDVLKYTPDLRLRVATARGESLFERGQFFEAIREYQNALKVKRDSSLAHYRMGEAFFHQRNYQSAANSFREAINGDRKPRWTLVWSRITLGKIFDITGQRERAVNEYRRALETNDNNMGAQAEAEKHLREPFRRESREIRRIEDIREQKPMPPPEKEEGKKEEEKPPSAN